jgi:hypothetical protein
MEDAMLLMCVMLGANSLVAVVMLWRYPRLWGPCIGVLATAAGIVLFLPIRLAFHVPSSEFDGFDIAAEFMLIAGILGLIHIGSVFILVFDRGDR